MAEEQDPVETGITTTKPAEMVPVPTPSDDVVVLARNPEEMVMAQQELISWARQKVHFEEAELAEAEENLAQAKKMKVRTAGWVRQVKLCKNRVLFYQKTQAALEAGFCIVPDFPVQVIGVRTSKKYPPKQRWTSYYGHDEAPSAQFEALPEGEGRYVDPVVNQLDRTETKQLTDGTKRTVYVSETLSFQPNIDFPFKMVKPQVLSDLSRAKKMKIFDEIGVLPATARRTSRDPMVIGRIRNRISKGNIHTINFLITWWVDTRSL